MVLQRGDLAQQFFKVLEWQHAYFAVLERDRAEVLAIGADRIEAQDFSGQVEAGDLFRTVFRQVDGLEGASAYCIEVAERIPHAVER